MIVLFKELEWDSSKVLKEKINKQTTTTQK